MPEISDNQRIEIYWRLKKGEQVKDVALEVGCSAWMVRRTERYWNGSGPGPNCRMDYCQRCEKFRRLAAGSSFCCGCTEERIIEDEQDKKFIEGLNGEIQAVYRAMQSWKRP